MVSPQLFFDTMVASGTSFFTGVPDSLLKHLCACITDNTNQESHIIAANEGNAIALAAGHHLATGTYPVVYMQNSGLGNAVNPLLSLSDKEVYSIPTHLIIGWRGMPSVKDEPQHIKQGRVTPAMLEAMEIPYVVLDNDENIALTQLKEAYNHLSEYQRPYALVVPPQTFSTYFPTHTIDEKQYELTREEAIQLIVQSIPKHTLIVSTTGMTSRELYEYRVATNSSHEQDFLVVGSMGHASQIALGIAQAEKTKTVLCLDGDGAVLMHMGSLAIVGEQSPENYIHIVLNNGVHDSVGGQHVASRSIDLISIATACGYKAAIRVETKKELTEVLAKKNPKPMLVEVMTRKGSRKELGRPKTSPLENKQHFVEHIRNIKKDTL